ncbi:MAG: PspA/IM30 family protein [Planctomycetales bacterium]|nr:PspA/IM30 family protein [Planctomycetales bacterium]
MSLFARIGDILSANLNELVDRFDDPETMLKQAIREMESALTQTLDGAARVIASEKLLTKRVAQHTRESETWQQRAIQRIAAKDDDGARRALRRRQEQEQLLAALREELTETETHSATLRRQIDAMHVKLAEARRKFATLSARRQAALARQSLGAGSACFSDRSQPLNRFNRLCEQVERAEAEAEAKSELAGVCWEDEFADEDDSQAADVESQLQSLKQQVTT